MDRSVTVPASVSLESFLLAVRQRLWLIRLAEAARTLLWTAGFILLALAAVHLLITAITRSSIFAIVGSVALFLLLRVARQRPSLAQCAAHADRVFSGHALMTTAVECRHLSKSASGFATEIVLRQADDAAKSWTPEISQRLRQSHASRTVLATIPLFVALVLLSLPGVEKGIDVDRVTPVSAAQIAAGSGEGLDRGTGDVAALRRIIVDESSANARPPGEQQSATALLAAQSDDAETVTELSTAPGQSGDLGGVAGLAGDDGDLPGNAIARSTPADNSLTASAFIQDRESIELQRTGPTFAAGRKSGTDYSTGEPWELKSSFLIQAAAVPESLTHATVLSRAQAAHARLYLGGPGKDND